MPTQLCMLPPVEEQLQDFHSVLAPPTRPQLHVREDFGGDQALPTRPQVGAAHQAAPPPCALVCTMALGTSLKGRPMHSSAIELTSGGSMPIGRQHQVGFFEDLLEEAGQRYIQCISRTHLEVWPSPGAPNVFHIKNHSRNPVVLNEQNLLQEDVGIVRIGDRLGFIAAGQDGPHSTVVYLTLTVQQLPPPPLSPPPQRQPVAEVAECRSRQLAPDAPPWPAVPVAGGFEQHVKDQSGSPRTPPASSRRAKVDSAKSTRAPLSSPGTAVASSVGSPTLPFLGAPSSALAPPRGGAGYEYMSESGSSSSSSSSSSPPFYLVLGGPAVRVGTPEEHRYVPGREDGLTVGRAHQQELCAEALSDEVQSRVSRDHFRIERRRCGAYHLFALSRSGRVLRQRGASRTEVPVGQAVPLREGDVIVLPMSTEGGASALYWSFHEWGTRWGAGGGGGGDGGTEPGLAPTLIFDRAVVGGASGGGGVGGGGGGYTTAACRGRGGGTAQEADVAAAPTFIASRPRPPAAKPSEKMRTQCNFGSFSLF